MKDILFTVLAVLLAPAAWAASFTGHWLVSFSADGTVRETSLYLTASGDSLTGYMTSNRGTDLIENGKILGDAFSFVIVQDNFGELRRLNYSGKLAGNELVLQMPNRGERPGPQFHLKQVSAETPGPMPPLPVKISVPAASPVPPNGLAKTPPMGWNSWNKFADKVSDKLIRETADTIASNGMKNAGYIYVNIDDTWQGQRDSQGNIQPNENSQI